MRFFRARSLILSPSKKSIARHVLPPKPALKSLSVSGRLAPWAKVSFTLSLWALPTAIIPSRDHTGLPIHFHSSIISPSASTMLLRMLASVLLRQSVSPAISWSIRSDGFIGSLYLAFLFRFSCSGSLQRLVRPVFSKQVVEGHGPSTSIIPKGALQGRPHTEHGGRTLEFLQTDY